MDKLDIGKAIKEGLKKKGLRQKDLALYMGKTNAAISDWIRNKNSPYGVDLVKLAQYLDIVSVLFPDYSKTNGSKPQTKSKSVGEVIKEGRLRKKMTQKQLAKEMGVLPTIVSQWELGEKFVTKENWIKLLEILDIFNELLESQKNRFQQAKSSVEQKFDEPNDKLEKLILSLDKKLDSSHKKLEQEIADLKKQLRKSSPKKMQA